MGGRLPFSFQPSPYRVRVKESSFFAASALECLQLPVLLGEAVEVESICPSNGSTIRLTVTGLGVTSHDPAGCVMSLAVPSLTRFFSSPETAALWLVAYPEAVILRLDQAWQLAIDLTTHQQRPDGATATTFID